MDPTMQVWMFVNERLVVWGVAFAVLLLGASVFARTIDELVVRVRAPCLFRTFADAVAEGPFGGADGDRAARAREPGNRMAGDDEVSHSVRS